MSINQQADKGEPTNRTVRYSHYQSGDKLIRIILSIGQSIKQAKIRLENPVEQDS